MQFTIHWFALFNSRTVYYEVRLWHIPVANLLPLAVLITVKSISKPAALLRPGKVFEPSTSIGHTFFTTSPTYSHFKLSPRSVSPRARFAFTSASSAAFLFSPTRLALIVVWFLNCACFGVGRFLFIYHLVLFLSSPEAVIEQVQTEWEKPSISVNGRPSGISLGSFRRNEFSSANGVRTASQW